MLLGVIYYSQATNGRQVELCTRTLLPTAHSHWSPGSHISPLATLNTQKHHQKQVVALTFFYTNHLITFLAWYTSKMFCEEYMKVKKQFFFRHYELYSMYLKFRENFTPSATRIRLNNFCLHIITRYFWRFLTGLSSDVWPQVDKAAQVRIAFAANLR
jgi:hypothetical protein